MIKNIKKKLQRIFDENFRFWEVIILMILTAVTGFIFGGYILKKQNILCSNNDSGSSLQEFISNYQYILNNYYGELNEKELLDKALQSILEEIDDPYATYMDEDEASNFDIQLSGSYQGIGIEIGNYITTGDLMIVNVIDDSPAQKAGLAIGDIIIKINDDIVEKTASVEVAKKIKETNGQFDLTVLRNNEEMIFKIKIEKVELKSVDFEMLDSNIGYIAISLFANNTYQQMKSALDTLESKGMRSLILDVRDNVGGYLTSVDKILGLFLDSKHIIYQIEDKTGIKKYYSNGDETKQYPIVILTNEFSASASEILTAALKEELGSISIGKKTYGKGTAQKVHTLSDGTKYKFTTQRWLTPSGSSIDENGITVDIEVSLDEVYYKNPIKENDNQLQEAIRYLQQ